MAGVWGIKFTPDAPSPRAKKPEYPPSAMYLYSNNKYHDLSIFNHLSVYFFFYFCSSFTNLDVASMMPNAVHWPLLIYYYFLIFKLN